MPFKCESTVSPEELPRLPLFPGQRQRWLLTLRMRDNVTQPELESAVRSLFQLWLPLFPGDIGEPELVDAENGPTSTLAAPPSLGLRAPQQTVAVEFDYLGPSTEMRWPTLVQRRRERIDPLCPMSPVDVMPIGVAEPEREADGDDLLHGAPPVNEDPLDLGLGPIDTAKFKLNLGIGLAAIGLGAGLLLYLAHVRPRAER